MKEISIDPWRLRNCAKEARMQMCVRMPVMRQPEFDPDLPERVAARIRRRYKMALEDAEDLAGEAFSICWEKRASEHIDPKEFEGLVFNKAKWLASDYLPAFVRAFGKRDRKPPMREFRKGLQTVLKAPLGDDPIESWCVGAREVVGLRSQRTVAPATDSEVANLPRRMDEFLRGKEGLQGQPPYRRHISTRQFLERFFRWFKRPLQKELLVLLLTPIHIEPLDIGPLPDPDRVAAPDVFEFVLDEDPALNEDPARKVWAEILKLPAARRAVVLLKMSEDELEGLWPDVREWLPVVIEGWSPSPPLSEVELAADGKAIAKGLGTSVGNVDTLRSRALDDLVKRLGVDPRKRLVKERSRR